MGGYITMKPKVVFLQEQLRAAAGTERISTGVMNELVDKGYQVIVVLFGTDRTSSFPLNDKIKVLLLGIPFENKYKLRAAFRLKKIISDINPDYVINVAVPMMQSIFFSQVFRDERENYDLGSFYFICRVSLGHFVSDI